MASATKRQVRVRPAVAADADTIARIHFSAFGSGPMAPAMYPGGPSEDAVAKFAAGVLKADPEAGSDIKVVVAEVARESGDDDEEIYDVVAFGKYGMYSQARSEEEQNKPLVFTQEMLGEGVSVDVFNGFIGGLHKMRNKGVGRDPYMYLNILAADPERQRMGAGSAILRWGSELADAAGLSLWLEASPTGYPLYVRHGYVARDFLDYPLGEPGAPEEGNWGEDQLPGGVAESREKGMFRTVLMEREAQKSS